MRKTGRTLTQIRYVPLERAHGAPKKEDARI